MSYYPAIDHQRIHALLQLFGDSNAVQELFEDFLDSCPEKLAVIKQGLTEERGDLIEFAAHAIHGSSAKLGAIEIEQTAGTLKMLAHNKNLISIPGYLEELEKQILELKEHIRSRKAI